MFVSEHYGPADHNWFAGSRRSLSAAQDYLRREYHGFALDALESAFRFAVLAWLEFKQVPRTYRDATFEGDYSNFREHAPEGLRSGHYDTHQGLFWLREDIEGGEENFPAAKVDVPEWKRRLAKSAEQVASFVAALEADCAAETAQLEAVRRAKEAAYRRHTTRGGPTE